MLRKKGDKKAAAKEAPSSPAPAKAAVEASPAKAQSAPTKKAKAEAVAAPAKAEAVVEAPAGGDSKDDGKKAKKDVRGPEIDTACHVLKGAIVSVLGANAAVTSTIEWETKSKAVLHVIVKDAPDGTPDADQIAAIQDAANAKIQEDVEVKQFTLPRAEAVKKYTANPVNHTGLFDEKEPPASVTEVSIVEIANWTVNACACAHTARTGVLQALFIQKIKKRPKKSVVEFQFVIGQTAVDQLAKAVGGTAKGTKTEDQRKKDTRAQLLASAAANDDAAASPATPAKAAKAKAPAKETKVAVAAPPSGRLGGRVAPVDELTRQVIAEVEAAGKLSAAELAALTLRLQPLLNTFQNIAYTKGLGAAAKN